jgi:hypothetical protein
MNFLTFRNFGREKGWLSGWGVIFSAGIEVGTGNAEDELLNF